MSLHTDIKSQMVEAMRAKDAVRLSVIRGLMSGFTNELVAKGMRPDGELADEQAMSVITRAVKQRKDSIEQFEKGGRADLAEAEKVELEILQAYLPAQMSRDEVEKFVKDYLAKNPLDPEKKNQYMGAVMKELKGKADGMLIKEVFESLTQ